MFWLPLTPDSISTAVDRLVTKGLVSRVESAEDRRVRIIGLTPRGKDLIVSAFRKHSGQMKKVLSEPGPEELRGFEVTLKKAGKRAAALMSHSTLGMSHSPRTENAVTLLRRNGSSRSLRKTSL